MITDQLVHAEVIIIQKQIRFFVTFVYGQNCYIQRRHLWNSLCAISNGLASSPWISLGDFNIIRYRSERLGGSQSWPHYIEEFNECCQYTNLDDLRYSGQLLTWSKGSGSSFLARKLDRVLVNPAWHMVFPKAEAIFHEKGASDHSPAMVNMGVQLHTRKPAFRFFFFLD